MGKDVNSGGEGQQQNGECSPVYWKCFVILALCSEIVTLWLICGI